MKKNKSLLLSILGGAIFCFVFLGMAFIFTNNTKIMKGNDIQEISVGDTSGGCARYNYYCPDGGSLVNGNQCLTETVTSTAPDDCVGGSWSNGQCHQFTYTTATRGACASCNAGYYMPMPGSDCQPCQGDGWYCPGGTSGMVQCQGYYYDSHALATSQSDCFMYVEAGYEVKTQYGDKTQCTGNTYSPSAREVKYGSTSTCQSCSGVVDNYKISCDTEATTSCYCTPSMDSCSWLTAGTSVHSVHHPEANDAIECDNLEVTPSVCIEGQYGTSTGGCLACPGGYGNSVAGSWGISSCYAILVGQQIVTNYALPTTCPNGYYQEQRNVYYGSTAQCFKCPANSTSNSSHTGCDCNNGYRKENGECVSEDEDVTTIVCYELQDNNTCRKWIESWMEVVDIDCYSLGVQEGVTLYPTLDECESNISGSSETDPSTTKSCASIPTSTQCLERSDCEWDYTNLCHDKSSESTGTCTITATNVSGYQHMSPGESVSVRFNVSGNCTGDVKTSLTHFTGPSTVSQNTTGSFTASPSCHNGTIKGCVKSLDDNKDVCSSVGIYIATTWNGPREVTISSGSASPTSAAAANQAGKDYYYTSCTSVSSNQVTCQKYTRGCNSGGGGSQTIPKCYQDENGVYQWTSSPEASWVVVSKSEPECNNNDACFEKPDGTRIWGKYYAQIAEGYRLITTIGDRDVCEHPSEDEACYVKDGDYKWSATEVEGYTKVEGLDDKTCQPELCYQNVETGVFEMGKYSGDGRYAKVLDEEDNLIKDPGKCKAPDEEACYEGPNGYEWGVYAGDADYTLVPEITEMSQCVNGKGDVPVPATGISISKIIYIFMAILMACGVGFIYYSSIVKKTEE